MRGKTWMLGLAAGLLMIGSAPVRAEAPVPRPIKPNRIGQALAHEELHPALAKFGRGVANALFGWLEIPLGVHETFSAQDTGGSFFGGLAHGLIRGVIRTGAGLYETVTFVLPIPKHYAPLLPTLPYFQAGKRDRLPLG